MPAIKLGQGSYKRTEGNFPEVITRNLYMEAAPTEASGVSLLPYPGLFRYVEGLDGAFRGLFQQAGTFDGHLLAVAGTKAYTINGPIETEIGTIAGDERVWIAANAIRAYITTGPLAYSTDGATVSTLATPDSLGFSSVGYINGYFLFGQTDTSRFYWLEPGETVIDPLNFANAERGPDAILAIVITGDEIWLFGEQTTEVWVPTGDPDAPFQRVGGRLYERGSRARDSIAKLDNTIFWVGDDGIVYRADANPVRVSEHGIEERIRKASYIEAWAFSLDGHTFYALSLGTQGTFLYDIATGQWSERQTYSEDVWRGRLGVNVDSAVYVGDNQEGILWIFDEALSEDDGGPMIRTATGGLPISGSRSRCNSFSLDCSVGQGPIYLSPVVRLEISDDGGNEYRDLGTASLGRIGKYSTRPRWTRMGMMEPPGRVFRVTVSDPTPWRLSQMNVNDVF